MGTVGRASKGIRIGYRHGFDSGTMLDYVYVNRARGLLGVGRLIDRVYLNAVGWRAIRARRDLLQEVLRDEIARRPGREVFVLDVAAGPGRYLQDLVAPYEPGRVLVLCRDLAGAGLWQGERLARERGLENVAYEMGDALAPRVPVEGAPDVVVVSGLYELLLDDSVIRGSLERLRGLLAPGGVLVFTTQTHHPQLDFIANVLPNRGGGRGAGGGGFGRLLGGGQSGGAGGVVRGDGLRRGVISLGGGSPPVPGQSRPSSLARGGWPARRLAGSAGLLAA